MDLAQPLIHELTKILTLCAGTSTIHVVTTLLQTKIFCACLFPQKHNLLYKYSQLAHVKDMCCRDKTERFL